MAVDLLAHACLVLKPPLASLRVRLPRAITALRRACAAWRRDAPPERLRDDAGATQSLDPCMHFASPACADHGEGDTVRRINMYNNKYPEGLRATAGHVGHVDAASRPLRTFDRRRLIADLTARSMDVSCLPIC